MFSRKQGAVGQVEARVALPERPAPMAKPELAQGFSPHLGSNQHLGFSPRQVHHPMHLVRVAFNSQRLALPEQIPSDLERQAPGPLGSGAQMAWALAQPMVRDLVRPAAWADSVSPIDLAMGWAGLAPVLVESGPGRDSGGPTTRQDWAPTRRGRSEPRGGAQRV